VSVKARIGKAERRVLKTIDVRAVKCCGREERTFLVNTEEV
jgi:hypothetical protein